jgi:hypothetical protein
VSETYARHSGDRIGQTGRQQTDADSQVSNTHRDSMPVGGVISHGSAGSGRQQ